MIDVKEVFKEPVKRSELPGIFGKSDRECRRIIAELSEEHNIINLQDGRGYVLADTKTAIRYAHQEWKRGIASIRKANKIIKRCAMDGNIGIVVPVRGHLRRLHKGDTDTRQITIDDMEVKV